MSVQLQRKPGPLEAWHLVDQFAMTQAATDLIEHGWYGAPAYNKPSDTWRLELNTEDDNTQPVFANIGDWLVLDMGLRKLTADECAANYDEAA